MLLVLSNAMVAEVAKPLFYIKDGKKFYNPPEDLEEVLKGLGAASHLGRGYGVTATHRHNIVMRARRIAANVVEKNLNVPDPYPDAVYDSYAYIMARAYKAAKKLAIKKQSKSKK